MKRVFAIFLFSLFAAVAVSAIVVDQVIKVAVKLNMYLHESFSVCGD